MRLGVHVFTARGPRATVANALERGCDAIQIFSSNPRGWALPRAEGGDDEALRRELEANDIRPVLVHAPYLVNIAAPDPDVYARSVASLVHAAQRARCLDGYVVVHAGRDRFGPRDQTLRRAAAAILTARKLVPRSDVLIEPTSGGRGSVASTPGELAELLDAVDDERVGVCLDTCHAHAAGSDLSTVKGVRRWIGEVDRIVGWSRVAALHVNDSRDQAGSCRDRHWHIGRGTIGETGMRAVLSDARIRRAVGILETPGTADDDRENLARARAYARGGRAESIASNSAARSSKRRRK